MVYKNCLTIQCNVMVFIISLVFNTDGMCEDYLTIQHIVMVWKQVYMKSVTVISTVVTIFMLFSFYALK